MTEAGEAGDTDTQPPAPSSRWRHFPKFRWIMLAGLIGLAILWLGTFLRSFTFGHVRQLEAVNHVVRQRAWSAGTVPGALVIDVDSTICEVVGKAKQGAGYGYTHVLGYHPLLATVAGTGEILHGRLRKGSRVGPDRPSIACPAQG